MTKHTPFPLAGIEIMSNDIPEIISKSVITFRCTQIIEDNNPSLLTLRGGLAAQFYINDSSRQRISSDIDFYTNTPIELKNNSVWYDIKSELETLDFVDSISFQTSEGYEVKIPMISIIIALKKNQSTLQQNLEKLKIDISFVPFNYENVLLKPNLLGYTLGIPIKTVEIEFIVVEKIVKFAFEDLPLPSRQFNKLPKQVFDLSNLLQSATWTHDFVKVDSYLNKLLYRESLLRKRNIPLSELLSSVQSGFCLWQRHLTSDQGKKDVKLFEDVSVPDKNKFQYQDWVEKTDQIKTFLNFLIKNI